jgi:hypothetical protein
LLIAFFCCFFVFCCIASKVTCTNTIHARAISSQRNAGRYPHQRVCSIPFFFLRSLLVQCLSFLCSFAHFTDLKQLHLVPDLFQHLGVYSSSSVKNKGYYHVMKTSGSFVEGENIQE